MSVVIIVFLLGMLRPRVEIMVQQHSRLSYVRPVMITPENLT